jgi:hypothetical protein
MEKIYVYIDETYNLQNKKQFYAFAGFVTTDNTLVKTMYRRLLKKLKLLSGKANKEIKSTDKDSQKIRNKLFKNNELLENIDLIAIYQQRNTMDYRYFKNNIYEQEVILYKELFKELILNIITDYKQDEIELHIIIEIDKNNKIDKNFYQSLKDDMIKEFNLKIFDIDTLESNISFGLQLADQLAGICREYIKEKNYNEFIKRFKILIIDPLSKK